MRTLAAGPLALRGGCALQCRFIGSRSGQLKSEQTAEAPMPASYTPPDLHGKVALVAGASRGAGRGIAVALGEAGATVYCTGRSSRLVRGTPRKPADSSFELSGRLETIEETAERVTARGGIGIAVGRPQRRAGLQIHR